MARKERMVTRTVDITVAKVMAVNLTTATVSIVEHELNGLYENDQKILDKINADSENVKAVAVQEINVKEVLYGMTETDFIKNAKVLPPRNGNAE